MHLVVLVSLYLRLVLEVLVVPASQGYQKILDHLLVLLILEHRAVLVVLVILVYQYPLKIL